MAISDELKKQVWDKAEHFNDECKKDQCGAIMQWSKYGDRESNWGWEIDHITPVSEGGKDILSNLRALHWKNNVSRQAERLNTVNPTVKAFKKENGHWANAEYNEEKKKYYFL